MSRLAGKAAIITGGEGSIGMAAARVFAADRFEEAATGTGATLAVDGGRSS